MRLRACSTTTIVPPAARATLGLDCEGPTMRHVKGTNETGVPFDSVIALEIVDPGPDGIDRSRTRVWVDGVLAFES